MDPLLASWFQTGGSRQAALTHPVDPSPESLGALLLAGRQRRDDATRSEMTEVGFSTSLWNGQPADVGVSVRCGSGAAIPGMTSNSSSIQLPPPEGDAAALYRRDTALAIVRSVVTAWEPSWCTWTSHRLRSVQDAQPGEVVAGWATYVAGRRGAQADPLPAGLTGEEIGAGLLLVADGDADSATGATITAVRAALRSASHPGS